MVEKITWEYIDSKSYSADTEEKAKETAKHFETLAKDNQTLYLDTSPAALFIAASECYLDAGDTKSAVRVCKLALKSEGDVPPDTRAYLLDAFLRNDNFKEAEILDKELVSGQPHEINLYLFVGESYEIIGNFKQSQKWFDLGIKLIDEIIKTVSDAHPNELAEVFEAREGLILSRYRLRSDYKIGHDNLDTEAEEILAEHDGEENDGDVPEDFELFSKD